MEQQARQSFSANPVGSPVDLLEGVLRPLLQLARGPSLQVVNAVVPALCGAVAQPVACVKELLEWHLRPRRPRPAQEVPVDAPDMADRSLDIPRYNTEVMAGADQVLRAITGSAWLSELLRGLQTTGALPELQEVLALKALHRFSQEEGQASDLAVRSLAAGDLDAAGFYGDDLLLERNGDSHVR